MRVDRTGEALRLIDAVPTPAIVFSREGVTLAVNDAYADLVGMSADEAVRRSTGDGVHPDDLAASRWFFDVPAGQAVGPVEVRLRHRTGRWIPTAWNGRRHRDGLLVATADDQSRSQEREAAVRKELGTDALTGLLNRRGLADVLRPQVSGLVTGVIDLNDFRHVNTTLGPVIGDELLRTVARRLRSQLPTEAVVARLGGDEFAVACPEFVVSPEILGELLADSFSTPFRIDGHIVPVTVGIGIGTGNPHRHPGGLAGADLAAQMAKGRPEAGWLVATEQMIDDHHRRMSTVRDLRDALGTGAFRPWFQPIVRIDTRQAVEYEALVRWQDSTGRIQPAGAFLPMIANTDLLQSVSRESNELALTEAATWPDHLRLSVNITPQAAMVPGLPDRLADSCIVQGLDPNRVTVELTENELLDDLTSARSTLEEIVDHGFQLALDDFGTGYSSLSYLTSLPVSKVKLDRSFLATSDDTSRKRLDAVIRFIHDLDLAVVVEGVETEDDHWMVADFGAEYGQGWLYGRPAPDIPDLDPTPTVSGTVRGCSSSH